MQPPSPEISVETLASDFKKLEKNLAKNNARLRKAIEIGIKILDRETEVKSEDLKTALQAIADSICTKPPGCDPEPSDLSDS